MASTSTSGREEQFDVYINHRGPDTKSKLTKPLYDCLHQAGIPTYLDFEETELGDYFPPAIKKAIFSATLHIAILSPQYAESAWCLAELALMFKSRARIIPLFCHVDPSDFRHIKGGVADAFSKHEEKGRYRDHDIQQWKDCLQNVSGIMGYQLSGQNDDLSKLCNDIIAAAVKEKQKRKISFPVAEYEVGLNELWRDFHSHCQRNGQMIERKIGIFGLGGSGKTTLAKYLFNRRKSEFSGSTILFDVRENDFKGALTSLQSNLLNNLKGVKNLHKFYSVDDGIAAIKDYFEKSHENSFLIVIDDVDHQKQLDALLPTDVLNPNSLVIITTREESFLIQAGLRVRYKMKKMNPQHSRELFCCHAFHAKSCEIGFENLVDSFVEECRGLPLALRVMGGHVFGSDIIYWKLQLDVVKATLDGDIKETLKISYDSLEEEEKQVFMDIACFFVGEPVSRAMRIWEASGWGGWRAEYALQTLKDKGLVEVQTCFDAIGRFCHYEPGYTLRMHDYLRDLGRAVADDETTQSRRLWRPEDLIELCDVKGFQDTLTGPERKSFRCYSFAGNNEFRSYFLDGTTFSAGYFLEISETSTYAQSLILGCSDSDIKWIPEWIPLQNLRSLSLYNLSPATLLQRDDQVILKLKELNCRFVNFPHVNKDMLISELVSSFGRFKHLESMSLEGCFELDIEWNRLLNSVRELASMETLMLRELTVEGEIALSMNREETIDDRLCMRSLEVISLCSVRKTRKVSIQGQFCPALKSLKLCSMEDVIEVDLTGVTTLECLVLLKCRELRKLLGNYMPKLEMFHIRKCLTMTEFPNFEGGSCLKRIYISHCKKLQDISAIERLKGLERIWIAFCPELKSIKAIEHLKGLKRIWIQRCPQLEGVICLKELKQLKRIFIGFCGKVQNIQGIEYLIRLESIIITGCPKLQNISGIEELKGLKEMIIAAHSTRSYAQRLQRLPLELTILVETLKSGRDKWRSVMSNLSKIVDILPVVYDEYATHSTFSELVESRSRALGERIKEMMDSFHENRRSLSTFIYCAVEGASSPSIRSSICYGSRIKFNRSIELSPGPFEHTLYMCVVNEGWLSKYDYWQPSLCDLREAYLMGVEAGEEKKTLQILESVIAQLSFDDDMVDFWQPSQRTQGYGEYAELADYDEWAEYADDDEKYDGSDDDD